MRSVQAGHRTWARERLRILTLNDAMPVAATGAAPDPHESWEVLACPRNKANAARKKFQDGILRLMPLEGKVTLLAPPGECMTQGPRRASLPVVAWPILAGNNRVKFLPPPAPPPLPPAPHRRMVFTLGVVQNLFVALKESLAEYWRQAAGLRRM